MPTFTLNATVSVTLEIEAETEEQAREAAARFIAYNEPTEELREDWNQEEKNCAIDEGNDPDKEAQAISWAQDIEGEIDIV